MSPSKTVFGLGLGLTLVFSFGLRPSLACEPEQPVEPTPEVPAVVSATSVQLNEMLPAPSSGEEFIELEVLDEGGGYLHGWSLQDASGKIFTFDQTQIETQADRFYVVYDSVSKLALNNTGDRVDLVSPSGVVVDSTEFGATEADESWSRFTDGWEWGVVSAGEENIMIIEEEEPEIEEDEENQQEEEPAERNPEEEEEGTGLLPVTQLRLNELLPNPEGDESVDEWIELLNEGEAGTLLGWSVTDGKSTYQFPDVAVGAEEFILVGVEDSGVGLNNTGDIVYLVGPEEEIVQGVEYGDAPSGESFARFGETWEWVDQLTPGEVNVVPENSEEGDEVVEDTEDVEEDSAEETDSLSLAEVRSIEKGSVVQVSGVVEVEPGPLGAQVIYIQDETGGMQIYSYQKDFPTDLMRGSLVSVSGITSSSYGEVRINADESGILVLEQQDEVLPQAVNALDLEHIGQLVVVEGTVESKSASRVVLDTGIEVYIKSSSGISLKEIDEGGIVRVVGIISQYNDALRLLPREQADVVLVAADSQVVSTVSAAGTSGQMPSSVPSVDSPTGVSGWIILSLAAGVILFGTVRSWWKKKRVAKRLFQPYTEGHESQRSTHSGHSVSVQLPPGA